MKKYKYILWALPFVLAASVAQARPVSYPSGWTLMQMNSADKNSLHVHYSPTATYSVGYLFEYMREADWQFHGAQVNVLAKRINEKNSQANFYIKSGLGVAYSDHEAPLQSEPAAFTGIAVDWEDRRYFTSYENRVTYAGDIDKSFEQSARLGVAPYVAGYGALHTWLMLQVDHKPKADDVLVLTPLVRFFKDTHLLELGASTKGDLLVNYIKRF